MQSNAATAWFVTSSSHCFRTCCHDSGKHPTLSELHRTLAVHKSAKDVRTSGPLPRLDATRVVPRPVANQHAVVVLAVQLEKEHPSVAVEFGD